MKRSISGGYLPQNFIEYKTLAGRQDLKHDHCLHCHAEFSEANTHSILGWQETQISATCENCYDDLFAEPDEPNYPEKAEDEKAF
jgi:hypothetical protein